MSAVGGVYTMVMNLLNFPAGVLTVDRETEEDQAALENYPTPCVELKWFKEVGICVAPSQFGARIGVLGWGRISSIVHTEAQRTCLLLA